MRSDIYILKNFNMKYSLLENLYALYAFVNPPFLNIHNGRISASHQEILFSFDGNLPDSRKSLD